MTRQEVRAFMERIRQNYPKQFIIDEYKVKDWNETLQYYSADDLNRKLEKHLCSEEYKDRVPSKEFLVKYLTPITTANNDFAYECRKCHKVFNSKKEYDEHYQRCLQIATVVRDMNKYYKLNLTREQFDKYDDKTVEKIYYNYIEKMLELKERLGASRKKVLTNCLPEALKSKYADNEKTETVENNGMPLRGENGREQIKPK